MKYLLISLFLIGCSDFIKFADDDYHNSFEVGENSKFSIIFSHNINGETHPCGCRKFPLGGLAQVFAQIKDINKNQKVLYVDSGDTFFDSPVVSKFTQDSARFKALKIAEALDKLGLAYLIPGDQDFALGIDFLIELDKKHKFEFLISNSSQNLKLPHKDIVRFDVGSKKLILAGLVEPTLIKPLYRKNFTSPKEKLEEILKTVKEEDIFVLLTHAGFDYDANLAKTYPKIDWIIGSHSQAFLTHPRVVNNTKIVQALSRNHYLGQIKFNQKEQYELLEMRDDVQNLIKPNPMIAWLEEYKKELDKVYQQEQKSQLGEVSDVAKIPTYLSCSECHEKQVAFWQKTSHSIAYLTLVHNKASNNRDCIKCHSVGMNQDDGFSNKSNIVMSENANFNHDQYWKELTQVLKVSHPIREEDPKQRQLASQEWIKFDKKNKVSHNFANVQCLNCHVQDSEHPFSDPVEMNFKQYQTKCLECHTRDQSPEWYDKDSKGLATTLNEQYFSKKFKEMGCPKIAR